MQMFSRALSLIDALLFLFIDTIRMVKALGLP
jgi:hypothetical protein